MWLCGGLGISGKEGNGLGDVGEREDELSSHHELCLHRLVQVEDREHVEEGRAKVVAEAVSSQAAEEEGGGEDLPHLLGQVFVAVRRGSCIRLQGADIELEEVVVLTDLKQVEDRVLLREGAEHRGVGLALRDNLQLPVAMVLGGEGGVGWLAHPVGGGQGLQLHPRGTGGGAGGGGGGRQKSGQEGSTTCLRRKVKGHQLFTGGCNDDRGEEFAL